MERGFLHLNINIVYSKVLQALSIMLTNQCDMSQVAQLSQRDRAAGWVGYGQKWKTVNGRQYFTDFIGLSSTIEVGLSINRKPVCDFLLVINSDILGLSRTVSELLQLLVQILDTAFLSHLLGLGTYDVRLGLIGKRVADIIKVRFSVN